MGGHQDSADKLVERYYDKQAQHEWRRAERHRTEFALTRRALFDHLPRPPIRVLDCGGGPGRYAIELARRGYDVTLFDLSSECLRLAVKKARKARVTLSAYEQGTATDLSRFSDESFDAVLLLGPLYHLLEEEERAQALAEARRVLKPGGTLFAAFISRYAPIRYAAAHRPAWPLEQPERLGTLLAAGTLPPDTENELDFIAYFAHPNQVDPICRRAGFEVVTVLGVEGMVSMIEEGVNALSGAAWDAWVDLNYHAADDPTVHGCVEHLLVVAKNPRWRAVLREITMRLNKEGMHYRISGGASIALHGVPVPVKDLDIETDTEGAYRFQELFADHALEPVTWRESETFRSHLGRFNFDGILVEVMGDLQRPEGNNWVPTAARTETTADLEGVPVPVSWPEETALAYIRQGRLDRAALCLPYCNHEHLLALLQGKQASDVF